MSSRLRGWGETLLRSNASQSVIIDALVRRLPDSLSMCSGVPAAQAVNTEAVSASFSWLLEMLRAVRVSRCPSTQQHGGEVRKFIYILLNSSQTFQDRYLKSLKTGLGEAKRGPGANRQGGLKMLRKRA